MHSHQPAPCVSGIFDHSDFPDKIVQIYVPVASAL